ncbi:MAG: superfamily [Bacteroidetes bacterium]|nr:superfamily [Bacteroidota bacterium]
MYSKTKHIFFDLDDTLWDFEKNSYEVLQVLFSEYSLSDKLKTDFTSFHTTYKEVNSQLWRRYYKKEIDKQFLRNNRFDLVFKKFSYSNYDENLKLTDHYLQKSPYGTHLKSGCIETLDYLKTRYTLHIITNGFKEVQHIKLNTCALRSYFQQIIISEEHQLIKPEEKIFRLAQTFAKCEKEDCLMIGDNLESDIEGALNAGWQAIWLNPHPKEGKINQISDLTELKRIL